MSSTNYIKGIAVRGYQHGGERRSYGRPVKTVLVLARTGKTSLNVTVHVGDERRTAVIVELDVMALTEAARELSQLSTVAA